MKIHKTSLSKTSQIPTQLEFLRAAYKRGLLKTSKEQRLYRNLEVGHQGEQFVLEALHTYGEDHWTTVQNLWLDHYGIYENDLILLTNHRPYVFEVKNYKGLFEYKDGRCSMNGNRLKENCIHQAEKAFLNLVDICRTFNPEIDAKGALLMVGEHNDVRIESDALGIERVLRNQLKKFVLEIAQEEKALYHVRNDNDGLLAHFEKNETLNPFGPLQSYHPQEVLEGRRGIYCKECGTYDVESTKLFVKCKRNHIEDRREAVLRMVHEFGVLTFESDFIVRREVQEFLGEMVSKSYLVNILNQSFVKSHRGKYARYVNKKGLYPSFTKLTG